MRDDKVIDLAEYRADAEEKDPAAGLRRYVGDLLAGRIKYDPDEFEIMYLRAGLNPRTGLPHGARDA